MAAAAERIMEWATGAGLRLAYGEGAVNGTVYPMLDLPDGTSAYTFSLWTNRRIEVPFYRVAQHEPYGTEAKRNELRELLNAIPGFDIPADGIDRYPTFTFAPLLDGENMKAFLSIWEEYLEQVIAANPIEDGPCYSLGLSACLRSRCHGTTPPISVRESSRCAAERSFVLTCLLGHFPHRQFHKDRERDPHLRPGEV